MDDHIKYYFNRGHQLKVIASYLLQEHNVSVSVRTIKRVLRRLGLRRNGISFGLNHPCLVNSIARVQLETDQRAGYRRSWHIINHRYRVRATQNIVRRYLRLTNPGAVTNRLNGVLQRRRYTSQGPNHVWHADGYDKLKPFGFCLHGCIDGFSRKILWLHCSTTNNDPKVILHYYLQTVKKQNGCPQLLRTDCGTETGLAAAAQCTLRNNPTSHIYGPSCRNQRIECWWSCLRKEWTQIWMDLFDDLVSYGSYIPNNVVHLGVAEFCFLGIIQKELTDFGQDWNSHRIRPTSTSGCPGGIPNELYELPHLHNFSSRVKPIDDRVVTLLLAESRAPPISSEPEIRSLCIRLCRVNNWLLPTDRRDATALFIKIINKIN